MKYLKLFEAKQTESKVSEICKKYNIQNWTINSEGLVDVNGDVDIMAQRLTRLPLNFGYVSGHFYCNGNELTSLRGSPIEVSGDFLCVYNKLTSLKGSPKVVSGDFYCHKNRLTSLEGGPQSIGGNFYCYENKLNSLRFSPEEVVRQVVVLPNPISDIPEQYLNKEYLQFIVKEQADWRLYNQDGSMRLDRLEEMIEWGIETLKIKPI
jgi:hypothetical protein